MGEVYVFTGICLSTEGGGGLSSWQGRPPPPPPPTVNMGRLEYGQCAVGTHPCILVKQGFSFLVPCIFIFLSFQGMRFYSFLNFWQKTKTLSRVSVMHDINDRRIYTGYIIRSENCNFLAPHRQSRDSQITDSFCYHDFNLTEEAAELADSTPEQLSKLANVNKDSS